MNNLAKALELFVKEGEASPPVDRFRELLLASRASTVRASVECAARWRGRIASLGADLWAFVSAPLVSPQLAHAATDVHPESAAPVARLASLVVGDLTRRDAVVELLAAPQVDHAGVLSLRLRVPGAAFRSGNECEVALVSKREHEFVAEPQRVFMDEETKLRFDLSPDLAAEWRRALAARPAPAEYPFLLLVDLAH